MKSPTGKILIHVFGSLSFLALPIIFSPDFDFTSRVFEIVPFRRDLLGYVLLLGVFYANYYVFIPQFFQKKKFFLFSVMTVLAFTCVVAIPTLIKGEPHERRNSRIENPGSNPEALAPPVMPPDSPRGPNSNHPPMMRGVERNLFRFAIVLAIALILRISGRLKQAERDKLDAELSYLKAQINPHFLFNTLNSIYSLAITRSELTAPAVVKLSEMMRYVTTEAHNDSVLLEKEIAYVSNYIELQRIRLGQTVDIQYSVAGTSEQKKIAPLVLIPFVENAFKYGVNPEEESVVTITIEIANDKLKMFVGNRIVKIDYLDEYKSGHGMDNVAQRLKMGYPGKHKLDVIHDSKDYKVNLEIEL